LKRRRRPRPSKTRMSVSNAREGGNA
jgi:hypothetical protein